MFSDSAYIIDKALDRFYTDEKICEIPKALPIVEDYCKEKLTSTTFAGMDVLFIQHHLGPFIPRIREMVNYGLEPSRCWFMDIPYSTCNMVRDELQRMDCPRNQMVTPFNDPIAPYSRRQDERVEYLLDRLLDQSNNDEILVIDDGAYFVRTLFHQRHRNKKLLNQLKKRGIKIVEQTTRGHRFLEDKDVNDFLIEQNIPAVSIARIDTKYYVESPFIGAAVARKVIENLKEVGRIEEGLGRVLVIGFGAVGKATTKELVKLEPDQPIEVYDKDQKLNDDIKDVKAKPLKNFPKKGPYDTVFGCTGYTSLHTVERLKTLDDDAVLISASSAAIEFNREQFIDLAYENNKDDFFVIEPEKTRNEGIHAPIQMNLGEKQFSFLNAGFPINFDGTLECVPCSIIQITHGLLVAAANQTINEPAGLHDLNSQDDKWFTEHGLQRIKLYAEEQKN